MYLRVSSIEGCFDRRSFRSIKVNSIEDKSQFSHLLFIKSKYLAWLWILKRTKNNQALSLSFYHHLLFYRNLCFDRTDVWFRSNEFPIETTFDRTYSAHFVSFTSVYPALPFRRISMSNIDPQVSVLRGPRWLLGNSSCDFIWLYLPSSQCFFTRLVP